MQIGRTAMAVICATAGMAATAAQGCSLVEVTQAEVVTGAQCAKYYADPGKVPQTVGAQPADDLGGGIVRQIIGTEGCGIGERIVTYTDCAAGKAVWLGGKDQPVFELADKTQPPVIEGSVAHDFIRTQEARFAPDYDLAAMLATAKGLPWIAQAGALTQTRIAVEGRIFDLNCGCKLFYPNGIH